ncbi:MAG: aldo/keto reductase [Streptosporangiaceae bacterium]|jgi:diketogulonate reductase-like aldo/keto reductase|nr:aldo/keto reductase [Actinomycetota bacterium]
MTKPSEVPAVSLPGGTQMPLVGFGTWKLRGHQAHAAVGAALAAGYRHIDTATMYGNEEAIGRALADSGIDRAELFLTTKLRPSDAGREDRVLRASLRALGTDHVDLWLVHWPPPRPQLSRQVWNEVRRLRDTGQARTIGVSNYTLAQLDDLAKSSGEMPAVNQVHWNPPRYNAEVLAGHRERGVAMEGYSPLKDTSLDDPVLVQIAAAHGVTPARVVLRWHVEHEIAVIPKSVQPDRIAANIDLFGFSLSAEQVARIDALGKP